MNLENAKNIIYQFKSKLDRFKLTTLNFSPNNERFEPISSLTAEMETFIDELEEAYDESKLISEASLDAIFRISITGKLIFMSASCKDLFGYETEEVIGQSVVKFIAPSEIKKVSETLSTLFKDKKVANSIFHILHKNGSFIPVEVNARIVNIGGKTIGQGTLHDIRSRLKAEEKLRTSENTFRTIWEESLEGMRLTDENGIVVMCNQAYANMTGKSKKEIERKLYTSIYERRFDIRSLEKYKKNK